MASSSGFWKRFLSSKGVTPYRFRASLSTYGKVAGYRFRKFAMRTSRGKNCNWVCPRTWMPACFQQYHVFLCHRPASYTPAKASLRTWTQCASYREISYPTARNRRCCYMNVRRTQPSEGLISSLSLFHMRPIWRPVLSHSHHSSFLKTGNAQTLCRLSTRETWTSSRRYSVPALTTIPESWSSYLSKDCSVTVRTPFL